LKEAVMGIETKRMSKAIAAAADDDSFGGRMKSWPLRVRSFYNDVRTEMRKVTTPSLKEVQATTAVVIITVFLFGLYFGVVDYIIAHGIDWVLHTLTRR
jgi:preprotein translocase subunit SecE